MNKQIQVGSRVCRRGVRDGKVVGTVRSINRAHARVSWDRSLQGVVLLSNGQGQSSSIALSALVLESEWSRRPIETPAESNYKTSMIRLDVLDGSGVCAYDGPQQNAWTFEAEDERAALAMAAAMDGEGKRVKVSARQEAGVVPAGCRKPRVFRRWITLFQSK